MIRAKETPLANNASANGVFVIDEFLYLIVFDYFHYH